MRSILETRYGLILAALLFSGIELFVWYYLLQLGYLQQLIESDRSMVSLFILAIYLLGALYFLYISFLTSRQFDDLQRQRGLHSACRPLRQFFTRLEQGGLDTDNRSTLLEVLDTRLRSGYAFAFIVADLMLKLGILGTVIGFIIMLGSLSNLNSVDITVMQTLLVEMSGGMKVALFTTLSGLIAGIVLNIKFNLVDWAVDHLINDIRAMLVDTELVDSDRAA